METIQDFQGLQFPNAADPVNKHLYDVNNVEYATSSYQVDHDMFPGLIALPAGDEDIKRAVKYAKANGYAVSVMSGSHQYSGACSTHGKGIQLNLRRTYLTPSDLLILPPLPDLFHNVTLVYSSVSQSLGDFNTFLRTTSSSCLMDNVPMYDLADMVRPADTVNSDEALACWEMHFGISVTKKKT